MIRASRFVEREALASVHDEARASWPHRAQTYAGIVCWALVLAVLAAAARSDTLKLDVFAAYVFSSSVLHGVWITILLTASVVLLGVVFGSLLCAMTLSQHRFLTNYARVYISVFRSVPPLVLMIFWFNVGLFVPRVMVSIPGLGTLFSFEPQTYLTPFISALFGLVMCEAAFMAELLRSGYLSVGSGVRDAALSLGIARPQLLLKILAPLVVRVSLPTLVNESIYILKWTTVAFAVSLSDILSTVESIYGGNSQVIPLLVVACFWYLVLVSTLMLVQHMAERRLGKGFES